MASGRFCLESELPDDTDDLLIELQELVAGRPFTGMAAGVFADMNGRRVELRAEEIATFVANTTAMIAEWKARGMPGLPIDARRHDKGDAAGWITAADLGDMMTVEGFVPVVKLQAQWTTLGQQLLADRIMTNFSPTVDLDKMLIRGGSLTNWPATVDSRGVPLFAAVELSEGARPALSIVKDRSDIMGIEITQEELDEMVQSRVAAQLAELNQQLPAQLAEALGVSGDSQVQNITELAELIRAQEQQRWQHTLAEMQRRNEYAELSAGLVGGRDGLARGIPANADELRDALLQLTPEQATYWSGLLGNIQAAGLTEFGEAGHGKRVTTKRPVPEFAVSSLKATIAAGNSIDEFFQVAGLGSAADFDTSPYEEK